MQEIYHILLVSLDEWKDIDHIVTVSKVVERMKENNALQWGRKECKHLSRHCPHIWYSARNAKVLEWW